MVLEMVFQIISTAGITVCPEDAVNIVETITARVLDGANLCLFSLTLLYLFAYQDAFKNEDEFFSTVKVNLANKALIALFRFTHLVLRRTPDDEIALSFLKGFEASASEVYAECQSPGTVQELEVVARAKLKSSSGSLQDLIDCLPSLGDTKLKSKAGSGCLVPLKKAYYTLALKEAATSTDKLSVLQTLVKEPLYIGPADIDLLDSFAVKVTSKEDFDTHQNLLMDLLTACKCHPKPSGPLAFVYILLIFEELAEYCRRHNDRQVLVRLFLEVQFVRYPLDVLKVRKAKALMIKYFPFYMLKNLSFLGADPISDIIEKHTEFKALFAEVAKPMKIDGIEVGLLNPLDLIESKKMKSMVTTELGSAEHELDMLRLEIEIWENFIHQIANFDRAERKNYQCMLVTSSHQRSSIFHTFLKMFPKLKRRRQKVTLGNFLQNLCIHNDDLVTLILHQGFDDSLIADAVEFIEWLHVSLALFDRLLAQAFETKKLHFYYRLLTATIKKYPAQIGKEVAKNLIVGHFAYVELNPEENQVILESIKTLLETFPSLETERTFLIQHYRGIQKGLCTFDISYIYIDRLTRELEKLGTK